MINYNKLMIDYSIGEFYISEGSIEDLEELISSNKEKGAVRYYISAQFDRCGDYEGCCNIEFFAQRVESDDEYNTRIKKEEFNEKENEKFRKTQELIKKEQEEKAKMAELELYLKLKEKFEK